MSKALHAIRHALEREGGAGGRGGSRARAACTALVLGAAYAVAALASPVHAAASSSCVRTGYIAVTNSSTGASLGAVGRTFNAFGEYGVTSSTSPADRLAVSFTDGGRFDLTTLNGPDGRFPYLGGIVGFANTSPDLGSGSYNYAYLGGTTQTTLGSPPASGDNSFTAATGIPEKTESAIWSISSADVLTAQWVNTGGSLATTYQFDYQPDNALAITGDPAVFSSTFAGAVPVTMTFVGTQCPVYRFGGFIAPIGGTPTINTAKAGRSIPVKFSLTDQSGQPVSSLSAVTSITYKSVSCQSPTASPTGAVPASATGGTSLRYDTAGGYYVYNWASPTTAGCYALFVTLQDGQSFQANFQLT